MNSDFYADTERLAEQAGTFDELVRRAEGIAGRLREDLHAHGSCWGTDDIGRSFDAAHTPAAQDALGTLDALTEGMGQMGSRLGEIAGMFADDESRTAAAWRTGEQNGGTMPGGTG